MVSTLCPFRTAQAEQAPVDGVGAGVGELDLVRAHAEAPGDGCTGVVEQQAGVSRGSVQPP